MAWFSSVFVVNWLSYFISVTVTKQGRRQTFRGHEWSIKLLQCSENYAFARNARKILVGARLLVLACFYKCLHARFLVQLFE